MPLEFDADRSCPSRPHVVVPRRPKTPDPIAVAFGQAIRDARKQRGETLEDLAGRIETVGRDGRATTMDPRYLGEIEAGWHAPTIVRAVCIADALELSLADLVVGLRSS